MKTLPDSRITREAGIWLYRLEDSPSPKDEAEFAAWLARSPEHVQEYLFMVATRRELGALDPLRQIDLERLAKTNVSNVVELPDRSSESLHVLNETARLDLGSADHNVTDPTSEAPTGHAPVATGNSRRSWFLGLAAAVVLVVAGGWLYQFELVQTYRTGVGEQRVLKLSDGSVVQLNTRSQLEVRFSSQERTLRLLDGEALFTAAHQVNRPFRVITDGATIQALGTQFNVYRRSNDTTVSVVEGLVQVFPGDTANTAPTPLASGEQAQVQASGTVVKRSIPDVRRATTWSQRRLDFRGATIAEIAEQFNRYNRLQIRIADAAIAKEVLDGVFDADEPNAFLSYLGQDKDVQFERHGEDLLVVHSRRSAPH